MSILFYTGSYANYYLAIAFESTKIFQNKFTRIIAKFYMNYRVIEDEEECHKKT